MMLVFRNYVGLFICFQMLIIQKQRMHVITKYREEGQDWEGYARSYKGVDRTVNRKKSESGDLMLNPETL